MTSLAAGIGMGIFGGYILWRMWQERRKRKMCLCLRANDGLLCAQAPRCGARIQVPKAIVKR